MADTRKEKEIRKQLSITSEQLFRSGLSKAGAGDLSRAAADLGRAVRYDKNNERARNLLGLVEFQQGELGEAMKQWSISEYLNATGNWASYYLAEIRKEETLLTNMSESIHLYNEAVDLADNGEVDFAIARLRKALHLNPHFVKAALLLTVCLIETKSYKAASQALDHVAKIDPLNPEAMRYRLYVKQQRKEGSEDMTVEVQDLSLDLYVQQSLPEPDLTESPGKSHRKYRQPFQGHSLLLQVAMLVVGVLLGAACVRFLWEPSRVSSLESQMNTMNVQMAQLEVQNSDLQQKVDDAGEVLKEVRDGGSGISETILADVKQLLEEWEKENPGEESSNEQ